jgi:hypothetical protein
LSEAQNWYFFSSGSGSFLVFVGKLGKLARKTWRFDGQFVVNGGGELTVIFRTKNRPWIPDLFFVVPI